MRVVAFLDLDDSLFQTRPKCPPGEPVRPAACRRDGTPLSFMTDRQAALFDLLSRGAEVIPTTARNLDAFRRVELPFRSFAILDFGGVVLLPGGEVDRAWDAVVRPAALAESGELEAVRRSVQEFIEGNNLEVSCRLIADFDLPLYVVMKHARGDVAALGRIRRECLGSLDLRRFFVHANDNNLSVVPNYLGKEKAVRHVLESHLRRDGPVLALGMGDSFTDLPFLQLCDFLILPRDSQLAGTALTPRSAP